MPRLDPPRSLDLYDFDDAIYLGSIGPSNRFAKSIKREASRWLEYVRRARLVLAGNAYLADAAREVTSGKIEVMPSCVDPSRYPYVSTARGRSSPVGWIGSATTSPFLKRVLSAVSVLFEEGFPIRMIVVGGEMTHVPPWLELRPWTPDTEVTDVAEFDIGVIADAGHRLGSGKVRLQASPVLRGRDSAVASPVGLARQLIGEQRGILADNHGVLPGSLHSDRWAKTWFPEANMGAHARAFVEAEYS